MSLVWVVCGAGRGLGKTALASRLCQVLPGSVYAKCGHGRAKAEKPSNYFRSLDELKFFIRTFRQKHRHIVVESNILARQGGGDITIFLDGIRGRTPFRKDSEKLRAKADIVISGRSRPAGWKKALRRKLGSDGLADEVAGVLAEQQGYLFGSGPRIRSKIWFEHDGEHVFGAGLARLLSTIDHLGTLREAAKATQMSYRYAWDLLSLAERHLGKKLVVGHSGGTGGGGTALSAAGRQMLETFVQLDKEVAAFADKRFAVLGGKGKADG